MKSDPLAHVIKVSELIHVVEAPSRLKEKIREICEIRVLFKRVIRSRRYEVLLRFRKPRNDLRLTTNDCLSSV
jgi:hypothetical protein